MCEPSILLPLKCGVQSTGLGWDRGHGAWSAPAVVRLQGLSLSGFPLPSSAVIFEQKFLGYAFFYPESLKAPW